jgi:thiamine biosynthesis lipoprotein
VREDSAASRLNSTGSAALSDTGAGLLRRTLDLCGQTDGALDVSVYPVVRAWGFIDAAPAEGSARIPAPETLAALLEKVDYRRIRLEGNDVSLPEGMEIDLGAVAKGYAGEILARTLREAGVESAVLALGGNIQTVGAKPDGSPWRVGIQSPDKDGLLGVLSVADRAVVTSGGYERFFTDDDGNVWWHIMDPATGYPARSGLISVTVIGESGLACDALSTALFIMGPERAVDFWRDHGDFEMVLATEDDRLLLTPGAADAFEADENLSYTVEVIGND